MVKPKRIQSKEKGIAELLKWEKKYLLLGESLTEEQGSLPVTVPEMTGVDEEMTGWSYFQLLEHNAIVNRAMSLNVRALMTGKGKKIIQKFNAKTDVLPQEVVGAEQRENFQNSIKEHLALIEKMDDLKKSDTNPHPVLGNFNAHMWHGMMGVHLGVHYKQLKMIVQG